VVAEALTRYAWPAYAALAFLFLVMLALTGERPSLGSAPFEPQGLMRHVALESVDAVDLAASDQKWRFERSASDPWRLVGGSSVAGFDANLPVALRLLHNSGPERMLAQGEVAASGASQFGLEKPRLRIAVHSKSGEIFVISFGSANALGSVRYAQIDGSQDVALLPAYVAQAWERVAGIQ
jgi:Domain of unknown function (DUF4340)